MNIESTSETIDKAIEVETPKKIKEQRHKNLQDQDKLKISIKANRKWTRIWSIIFWGAIIERFFISNDIFDGQTFLSVSLIIISGLGLIVQSSNYNKNQIESIELSHKESIYKDEIFIEDITNLDQELRALKQLTKKQNDLEKYYNLNLLHTKIIFVIGVVIIFMGIAIIVATIGLVFFKHESTDTITIIMGFVGGILVDAIGAIFIIIYSKTVETANMYQIGLVKTANIYLGNTLASQISEDELRNQTYSELAKKLVSNE